jgi:hypothetical protein
MKVDHVFLLFFWLFYDFCGLGKSCLNEISNMLLELFDPPTQAEELERLSSLLEVLPSLLFLLYHVRGTSRIHLLRAHNKRTHIFP